MADKPSQYPTWANLDENDPTTNAPNKEEPSPELKASGLKRKQPFWRSHINWLFNNIGQWVEYLDTVNSTITVDTTIYVATTGDDVTGDGSVLNPFATPQRALESLIGVPIATDALVTIFCAAGNYTFTTPIKLNHPYGERIHIIGDSLSGTKPSGAQIADWSSDRLNPVVPARGVNEFFNSSGILPVNSNVATKQAAIMSDLTDNFNLLQSRYSTIFNFDDCSGVVVDGNNSLGKIDKVVLKGDWDGTFVAPTEAKIGVDIGRSAELLGYGTSLNVTGGSIFLGKDVVIIGFHGEGCRIRYSGSLTSEDGISIVNNYNNGARVEAASSFSANVSNIIGNGRHGVFTTGSSVSYLAGSLSTGNVNNGCQSTIGSTAVIRDFTSCGNGASGVIASVGSTVNFDNGISIGNGNSGIYTITGSTCDGDSVTATDNNLYGIYASVASQVVGTNITASRNTLGLFAVDNGNILLNSGTASNNANEDVYAVLNSYIKLGGGTTASGDSVKAEKRSYVNTGQVSGVSYSPSYGSTGSDGSLIGN